MLPVINAFKAAHQLTDVTVVADAGMISETNQTALQAAGLSFILGARIPFLPDVVREWRDTHPDQVIPDGLVLTQPWPSTSAEKARGIPDRVIHYQYRHDRARRTLRGIDEQVAKAERAVDGKAPVKRNRYTHLSGAQVGEPTVGSQDPRAGRVEGLCRCWGYADRCRVVPGGGRAWAGLIGIITDSWSERDAGLPCNSGRRYQHEWRWLRRTPAPTGVGRQ